MRPCRTTPWIPINIRILAESERHSSGSRKLPASGVRDVSDPAQVTAGVGEIASTPGGLQTNSLVRFVKDKIAIHAGDMVEWSNSDPQEPHTITFGPEPADLFDPSPNVTQDADGGLRVILHSPADSAHSGFILQALDDQPGTPVNVSPNNSIALNPTRFRVTFLQAGTYKYICALHDTLGWSARSWFSPSAASRRNFASERVAQGFSLTDPQSAGVIWGAALLAGFAKGCGF